LVQDLFKKINESSSCFFITGKAGTGKSTFIQYFTTQTHKKVLKLAFTGIAAINVGGQTIHSFFLFPLKPMMPNDDEVFRFKQNTKKYKLIQSIEVIVIDDGSEASITEFGILQTHSSLGTVGAAVSTNGTQITFTPEPSIDVEVRVFQNALGLVKENILETSIDLTNAEITTGNGFYEGTEKSVRRSFDLTHNQNLIFQRYFDGSDSNIVDINSDTIRIPDHYFVSGEEVIYAYAGAGTTQAIGIAQTVVTGIGLTNKLPSSVYIVKLNESTVRLAATAEDALKSSALTFDITSVGIGTSHTFIAKNQNTKNIIAIDNYFQSPIVGSSITTTLGKDASIFDNRLTFTGITSFFSGNLIQINNEIMKINTVGLGSTNVILVDRPWMGTGISSHPNG
jgi:hypothetical protein